MWSNVLSLYFLPFQIRWWCEKIRHHQMLLPLTAVTGAVVLRSCPLFCLVCKGLFQPTFWAPALGTGHIKMNGTESHWKTVRRGWVDKAADEVSMRPRSAVTAEGTWTTHGGPTGRREGWGKMFLEDVFWCQGWIWRMSKKRPHQR